MEMRRAGLVAVAALVGALLGAGCATGGGSGSRGAAGTGAGSAGSETGAVAATGAGGGDVGSGTGGADAGGRGAGSGGGAAGASAGGGAVQVYEYADSDGAGASVILTGAIGDFGAAVSVYPDGAIDPQHDSQVNLALTKGSFRIGVAALDKKIVSEFSHFQPDPRTCSGIVRATATTPVVPGSGTGAYRGIGGSFTLTVTIAEIVPKSRCDGTGALLGQAVITTGSGRVSLR
jgi:hypothetical protein